MENTITNLSQLIKKEIEKMDTIVLLEGDLVGSGINGEVYSFNLLNCNLAVKCF